LLSRSLVFYSHVGNVTATSWSVCAHQGPKIAQHLQFRSWRTDCLHSQGLFPIQEAILVRREEEKKHELKIEDRKKKMEEISKNTGMKIGEKEKMTKKNKKRRNGKEEEN
jgi:hypothetical protein